MTNRRGVQRWKLAEIMPLITGHPRFRRRPRGSPRFGRVRQRPGSVYQFQAFADQRRRFCRRRVALAPSGQNHRPSKTRREFPAHQRLKLRFPVHVGRRSTFMLATIPLACWPAFRAMLATPFHAKERGDRFGNDRQPSFAGWAANRSGSINGGLNYRSCL